MGIDIIASKPEFLTVLINKLINNWLTFSKNRNKSQVINIFKNNPQS